MSFLPIAIAGYLLNTIATLVDKALLERDIPNPMLYTFYLGILSLSALFLIPFGFEMPSYKASIYIIISGLAFSLGWLFLYVSLQKEEATRVAPIIGTLSPIFTFLIGYLTLAQALSHGQLIAFFVLMLGLFLLSSSAWFKSKLAREHLLFMAASGFFFALSSVFLREGFVNSNFITTLVGTRIVIGLFALSFLFSPSFRRQLLSSKLRKDNFVNRASKLMVFGQAAGAIGGLLLAFAISMVNPAVVNSMQGIQYVFILAALFILPPKIKILLDEQMSRKVLIQKVAGAVVVSIGLAILAFTS